MKAFPKLLLVPFAQLVVEWLGWLLLYCTQGFLRKDFLLSRNVIAQREPGDFDGEEWVSHGQRGGAFSVLSLDSYKLIYVFIFIGFLSAVNHTIVGEVGG